MLRSKQRNLLVILMLSFSLVLSACSSGGNSTNQNESPKPNPPVPAAGETSAKPERKELTLKFFLQGDANSLLPKGGDDFVLKTIEEKFKVKLEVENYPTDGKEKLNLMISSGSTPDLFLTDGRTAGDFHQMGGVLADLTPYLDPAVMPNLYKWVTPEAVKSFQYPGVVNRGPRPVATRENFSYFIRKDWLDKLSLPVPTNYEELTKVMQAFTFNDPDGNKKNDTYGISMPGSGKQIYYAYPQFRKNGLLGTAFVDKNGDYHDSQSDPLVGTVIDDIRVWQKEGLIDPDGFLSKAAAVGEKFAQGRIGMVWVLNLNSWIYESNPNSYYSKLKTLVPEAEVVPFNPFPEMGMWVGPYMTAPWLISADVAKKSPEKVERIIEILDWMASEEGYLLTHYGVEGKHYVRNGNQIDLKIDAIKTDIQDKGNFLSIWNFLTPDEPERIGLVKMDPGFTDRDRSILKTISTFKIEQGLGTSVTAPADTNISDFRNKMYELSVKMLYEEKDSSNWPKYREELMTTYKGQAIFQDYIRQMREVGIKVNDFK